MNPVGRLIAWTLLIAAAIVRPGVDALDHRLTTTFWNVPSQWNAVADLAVRSGSVDDRLDGVAAPWRQASIVPFRTSRVAVVTVSNMRRSRIAFLNERYRAVAVLERATEDPALVTDEVRGYKPLSHVWPLVDEFGDGRIETLVAFAPMVSQPPNNGLFAYLALGDSDNELLFACRLRWAPGPSWGVLERVDVNGDGIGDLVVHRGEAHPAAGEEVAPLATFKWDTHKQAYLPLLARGSRGIVSWWSTTPEVRIHIPRDQPIDDVVARLMAVVERNRFEPLPPGR